MNELSVSVIVVSHGRAELLQLCLTGLGQLYYPNYEIIVVADPAGIAAVQGMGLGKRIKLVPFEAANISAARNAGIVEAAGDIVAFIDDDAVPEPTWLKYLTEPFEDKSVGAAGGFVRGRNGISYQWLANLLSKTGKNIPLDILDISAFVPKPPKGGAVKTEGTNCAFRRSKLMSLGGFDPVFRFFNDESDLNMRLARDGVKTALLPMAQVHHGYAASDRRAADRAPVSLFEIGASTIAFFRKHSPEEDVDATLNGFINEQRNRLLRHMVSGGLEPRDVEALMEGLRKGIEDGKNRALVPLEPLTSKGAAFLRYQRANSTDKAVVIAGRWGSRRLLAARAKQQVRAGNVVSVYRFSPSVMYHQVRFRKDGYWEQAGGLFGRGVRTEKLFFLHRFRQRVQRESMRVASVRQNV